VIRNFRLVSTCLAEHDDLSVPAPLTQRLSALKVEDWIFWNGASAATMSRRCGKAGHGSAPAI
jgi:hypothetical protein